MKKMILLGALASMFSTAAFSNVNIDELRKNTKADYFCTDGKVVVEVFMDGPVPEEFDFDRSIFQNNHAIKITTPNNVLEYKDFVIATNDGAGQESFQAFVMDRLAPLKMVVDFYFEHEGGYLAGSFQEITNFNDEGVEPYDYEFGAHYQLDEKMLCHFDY